MEPNLPILTVWYTRGKDQRDRQTDNGHRQTNRRNEKTENSASPVSC